MAEFGDIMPVQSICLTFAMAEKTYRRPRDTFGDDTVFGDKYDQKTLIEKLRGTVSQDDIDKMAQQLLLYDSDEYIESALANGNDPTLTSAAEIIPRLGPCEVVHEAGPLYIARLHLSDEGPARSIGVIAQNRRHNNGAWMPEHHRAAARWLREFNRHLHPVITFVDTPGAEAGEQANLNNQAHSIAHLITEAGQSRVPVVSVLWGLGYSGGAIPLFCGNLLLALNGSVFSTIQPQGLSSIARKHDLSWQQCARIVGVSCWQLYQQGIIDGIIDYNPATPDQNLENLIDCLVSALGLLDERTRDSMIDSSELRQDFDDHFRRTHSRNAQAEGAGAKADGFIDSQALSLPTLASHYLVRQRYHHNCSRLRVSQTSRFGLLSDDGIPQGEQLSRMRLERDASFYGWIQNTPRVVYDDKVVRLYKRFANARDHRQQERGRLGSIIFGRPEENYRKAIGRLCSEQMQGLFNLWKSASDSNLDRLTFWLQGSDRLEILYQVSDIPADYEASLKRLRKHKALFDLACRSFTHEGRKSLLESSRQQRRDDAFVRKQICLELNLLLNHPNLYSTLRPKSPTTKITVVEQEALRTNKSLLDEALGIAPKAKERDAAEKSLDELTILDLLATPDLQPDLLIETLNLTIFNRLYNYMLENMHLLSGLAEQRWTLDLEDTEKLYGEACADIIKPLAKKHGLARGQLQDDFNEWLYRLGSDSAGTSFLAVVDEWKRREFPRVSDTFFAILSHIFYGVLPSLLKALNLKQSSSFEGRVKPLNIGQRKDFWNRLNLAFRDLKIDLLISRSKRERPVKAKDFISALFSSFSEGHEDLISADPCSFPGFRQSLDTSIKSGQTPCGIIVGTGTLKGKRHRVGALLSNPEFQAGSFDMASCHKLIALLDTCEEEQLPVLMFVSSGGMQTKEGAAALFSMAISVQRISEFVMRTRLPVLVFAYGDCTGGAQASFCTHPMVQTWYCSGSYLPFAGRIVVPEHLPLASIMSNFLVNVPGAMDGLVQHPFHTKLDESLQAIDPSIPGAEHSIDDVIDNALAGKQPPQTAAAKERPARQIDTADIIVRPIKRLLIHARGCTASKLVRVAQRERIPIVLVQSDPDLDSAVADQLRSPNDQLVAIGGNTPDQSYLNGKSILQVAEQYDVDALHPGIGFLSENANFARQCIESNINFIGPSPSSMDLMGNKSNAISTALRLGVPVVPGSHGIVADVEQAKVIGQRIGYPLILKAVHGGGGRGIEIVRRTEDMYQSFFRVANEARSAFGNGDVYIEKFIENLRHIEVQILCDHKGNIKIPGMRDCSVQRNRQKIIEESDSPVLSVRLRRKAYAAARALAKGVGYVGAGTVEFIHDLDAKDIYFMEMNTRLQIEHPVTEISADIDIVAEQLNIAAGGSISFKQPSRPAYAIEARITAERTVWDAESKRLVFYPDPGLITAFDLPQSRNIETISAVSAGKTISPYYDSMIVQVIATAANRKAAAQRLRRYLGEIVIEGVSTNIPLLRKILADRKFQSGDFSTDYLNDLFTRININQFLSDCQREDSNASAEEALDSIRIPDSRALKVLAPSTGVCYLTPSPNEPDYLSENQVFGCQSTMCQIEAMKVFSPVSLEQINLQAPATLYDPNGRWRMLRANFTNGSLVNTGDLLFVIEPAD